MSPILMSFDLTLSHPITIHYKFIMIKSCNTNSNNLSIHWPKYVQTVIIKAILFKKAQHYATCLSLHCNCSNFVTTTALGTMTIKL